MSNSITDLSYIEAFKDPQSKLPYSHLTGG